MAAAWIAVFVIEAVTLNTPQPLAVEPDSGGPRESESAETALGKTVPDCVLNDLDGHAVRPDILRGHAPTMIEFGSFTCPYCTGQANVMDDLSAKYRDHVRFIFVYGEEAHPGIAYLPGGYRGSREPFTYTPTNDDRLAAAKILRDTLGLKRDVLIEDVDSGNTREQCYLRSWMYHPGIVVAPDGKIVYAAKWLKADLLDKFLAKYLATGGQCDAEFDDSAP